MWYSTLTWNVTWIGLSPLSTDCAVWSYCGDLTLEILSWFSYCEYGESLAFWKIPSSYTTQDLSTGFVTQSGNAKRFCEDNQWLASWNLTIQASDVYNITTNNSAHTIPASSVFVKNSPAYKDIWVCTSSSWDSLNEWKAISSPISLLGKVGVAGDWCKISTDNVELKVTLTWGQAIGQYSGTLTINLPSF